MKFPIKINCTGCHEEHIVHIKLEETLFNVPCPSCGINNDGIMDNNVTIGDRLLERSIFELHKQQDYPMSIVFSATAFECELSNLFYQWYLKGFIDALVAPPSDKEVEDVLRGHHNIVTRIKETGRLMFPEGIIEFIRSSTEFRGTVENNFPSLRVNTFPEDVTENLFWPRNQILHMGKTEKYQRDDAIKCFNIAFLGILILKEMDKKKWAEIEQDSAR